MHIISQYTVFFGYIDIDLDILGLYETHLSAKETLLNKGEYTIILSGRKDGINREGVMWAC